jgi:hypothetical protein
MKVREEGWWQEHHAGLTTEWREMPAATREGIPEHLQGGLDRYILHRIKPGDFLLSLLSNDLEQVVGRAAPPSVLLYLPSIFHALHGYAPRTSYGSPEAVRKWLAEGLEEVSG